ncbi:blue copper protein-like [Typha angustifolia]|uniref:blue copper protein-like n=1 Tax=Typha angustifolia TaxID=59011 RepID=UPI003C2DD2DD
MASYNSLALGVLLLLNCATWGSATVYTVGDKSGWTIGPDYSTWTSGKSFVVGDSLVFNYATGTHTVTEVSSSDYASCSSTNSISSTSTGPTTIALDTAGTHNYICAIAGHCASGMKLSVTVATANASSPSSPTPPSGTPSTPSTPTATSPPSTTTTPSTTTNNNSGAVGLLPTASALIVLTGLVAALF